MLDPIDDALQKAKYFHYRCIRIILGIPNRQQWSQNITMAEVRRRWGDTMLVSCRVKLKCLEWLGHLVRMSDTRLPKRVFLVGFLNLDLGVVLEKDGKM